jgi:hemolysin D
MVNPIVKNSTQNNVELSIPQPNLNSSTTGFNPVISDRSLSDTDWSASARELLDSLPRVWTKGLLYVLVGFAAIAIPYAAYSKVDETGTAKGRLEPEGMVYRLDAPLSGNVTRVRVKSGQQVKKGEILLELDSDLVRTDLTQAEDKLEGLRDRITQLEALQTQLSIARQTQMLQSQSQVAEQSAQIGQVERQKMAGEQRAALAQQRLLKDRNEVDRYRQLESIGVSPTIKVVELERIVLESEQLLAQAEAEIVQADGELEKQQSALNGIISAGELSVQENNRQVGELQSQIIALQSEATQTEAQIKALNLQIQQRMVRSPVDGVIFDLPIARDGAVVQPSQMVAQIAPAQAPLILKAEMPPQESGFLQVGMPVKVKFDAYPFQDYGIITGNLRRIAPNSTLIDTPQGKTEVFEIEVALDRSNIQAQNRSIALTPGQTATAEVIIRQRRIIDFVLDPLKQLRQGGLNL